MLKCQYDLALYDQINILFYYIFICKRQNDSFNVKKNI